jgi:hypothetical protein
MRSRGESRFGRYLEGVGIRSLIGEIRPVAERRRAVALARHSVRSKGSRSRRSPRVWADRARRSTRTSTTPPARRRGAVKAGCAAAVAPTRSRATARATRTRSARPAIPARSSAVGPPSGCSRRCSTGAPATEGGPPHTTGRAPTPAGVGERRSRDLPGEWPAASVVTDVFGSWNAVRAGLGMISRAHGLRADAGYAEGEASAPEAEG